MKIDDRAVMHAMNRLASCGPQPKNPNQAFAEWKKAFGDPWLKATREELEIAVTRFISESDKLFFFPGPGEIKAIIRSRRPSQVWSEAESEEPAPPGTLREVLKRQGIDLDNPPHDIVASRAKEKARTSRSGNPGGYNGSGGLTRARTETWSDAT